jgi:tRNA(Ile)-lysidine synthase
LPASLELRLRTRRQGDRFKPKGMGGHSRKLKDWMIDRKIPREIRDQIPLVCADGEIIAICLGDDWHLADTNHIDRRDTICVTLILA